MFNYGTGSNKGTTPYTAPRFVIYENKTIKYDETGNIRAIVDIETEDIKANKQLKKKLIKIFFISLAVCIVLEILRLSVFTYTAKRWQKYPSLRPAMVGNLIKISKPSVGTDAFIHTITDNYSSFTNDYYRQKYNNMRDSLYKNSLLLNTDKEIHEALGEPYKTVYEEQQSTIKEEYYNENHEIKYKTEYFYAYSLGNKEYSVSVLYYENIAIRIQKEIEYS